MANTSASGGVLDPQAPLPPDDSELDAILQPLVVAITGLDGSLVRPRWQTVVPKMPEPTVNWCAIGVMTETPNGGPQFQYVPGIDAGTFKEHQALDIAASFYGPAAKQYAARLRDGLRVPQNTDTLRANDMGFVGTGTIRTAPEFINQQWYRRCDLPVSLRRKITRQYAVKNLLAAAVHLIDDTGEVDSTIVIPPGSTFGA
jgi:hypothetical protein